jgi:two-component system phosphate regulon sensor histidine kinase PhoR
MWSTVTIVLLIAALIALHLAWRKRFLDARKTWQADSARRASIEMVTASETRARQDALLDSMIEGVLVLDESNRVQFANRAFAQMFSTVGMLQGKAVAEAVRVPEVAEIVKRTDYEGRVIDHELRMPGGPERWLQISAAAISSVERRRLGTVLVFHDLTRTKRLERTREEFVANVSHELRTPLSLIKGYTETLLDGAKDNQEVSTRFLQTIARNAERLKLLIEDLLTISELESGRVTLNIQTMDLCDLVDKVVEDFKSRASGRNVVLTNDVPELSVRADSIRLEQVFSNLVDNAIKYGRQGGRVNIGISRSDGGKVEVFVRDDGPGLPPESLERVFERFYRVDKARSREQGGTGLGLSIVKHIVQSHGGRVWARSEPGQGVTFFFTLPEA